MKNKDSNSRLTAIINLIFFLLATGNALFCVISDNMFGFAYSLLSLVLLVLPLAVSRIFKLRFPAVFELSYMLFVFCAVDLGTADFFYDRFFWWDIFLHTAWGFLCSAIGFFIFSHVSENRKMTNVPKLIHSGFAFLFSLSTCVIWEFLEFAADVFFKTDVQKDTVISGIYSTLLSSDGSVGIIDGITEVTVNGQPLSVGGYIDIGLFDTMEDLLVGFAGAVVFFIISLIFINRRKRDS